jgi:hypothetical protein
MKYRLTGLIVVWSCLWVSYGCRDRFFASPTAIGTEPNVTEPDVKATSETGSVYLRGRVTDAEDHPIAGTLIEVIQGAEEDPKATTGLDGRFELVASSRTPTGMVVVRASHEGYLPRLVYANWLGELPIIMDVGPAIDLQPGPYTWTVSFKPESSLPNPVPNASACSGFPSTLTSRSYRVEVAANSWTQDPNDRLITIEHALWFGDRFELSVIGRYIRLNEIDGWIAEELPGIRFLTMNFGGPPPVRATVAGRSVSFLFHGGFHYCQLRYPLGHYYDCSQVPADGIVEFRACYSDAAMTFTPR